MHCPRDPSQELVKIAGGRRRLHLRPLRRDVLHRRRARPPGRAAPGQSRVLDDRSRQLRCTLTVTVRRAAPVDGTAMKKVDFNIHTDIILDFCPTCGGFWLDCGELERINTEVRELERAGSRGARSADDVVRQGAVDAGALSVRERDEPLARGWRRRSWRRSRVSCGSEERRTLPVTSGRESQRGGRRDRRPALRSHRPRRVRAADHAGDRSLSAPTPWSSPRRARRRRTRCSRSLRS